MAVPNEWLESHDLINSAKPILDAVVVQGNELYRQILEMEQQFILVARTIPKTEPEQDAAILAAQEKLYALSQKMTTLKASMAATITAMEADFEQPIATLLTGYTPPVNE